MRPYTVRARLFFFKNDIYNRLRLCRLTRPDLSSPGGPHTVRTSSFAMVGNTVITIDNLRR